MESFTDKLAVVTGGGSGMGRERRTFWQKPPVRRAMPLPADAWPGRPANLRFHIVSTPSARSRHPPNLLSGEHVSCAHVR